MSHLIKYLFSENLNLLIKNIASQTLETFEIYWTQINKYKIKLLPWIKERMLKPLSENIFFWSDYRLQQDMQAPEQNKQGVWPPTLLDKSSDTE